MAFKRPSAKQAALIPSGYLRWGEVHTLPTDLGVLTHVCHDEDGIYTGAVKASKWEVRRWETASAQSTLIAASEDHIAMKCFEVCGEYIFICFANGKMEIYNKGTQAPVRKPIAAHGSEIKFIAKGRNAIMYTSDLENQVRSWHAVPHKVESEQPLGPISTCNDSAKQVNWIVCTASDGSNDDKVWTGAMDGKVYVYDVGTAGELSNVRTLTHESMKAGVRCLVESNGAVYSGAEDGRIAAWDLGTETFRSAASVHSNIVSSLCEVGDLLWSGGHDARVCAMDDRCSVLYQVGTLKDNGDVAQAGGTKAIIRAGWNVWVFGMKGISIYSPHCVIDPLVRQIDDAAAAQERLKRQLKAKDTALDRKQHELEDSQSALVRDQERWEGLAAQQQKALDTLKGERDEAVAESRGLRDEAERQAAAIASMQAQADTQIAEAQRMTDELSAVKAAAGDEAGQLAADLEAKEQELAAIQARCDAAEKDAEQTRAALKTEQATSRSQTEAAAASGTRCSELEEAVAAAQSQLQAVQEELQKITEDAETQQAAHAADSAELQNQLEALRRQCQDLETSLQEARTGDNAKADRIAQLESELLSKAALLDASSANAGENAEKLKEMLETIKERDARIEALVAERDGQSAEAGTAAEEVAAVREELRQQGAVAAAEAAELQRQLAEMTASREAGHVEQEELKKRLAAAVSDTEGGAAQIRELETALGAARADAERLQSACNTGNAEVDALKLRIAELERQLCEGNESSAAASEASEALKKQLEDATAENLGLQKQQQGLQEALDTRTGEVQAAQAAYEAAQAAHREASAAQEGLSAAMARTEDDLAARSAELAAAQEQLVAARQKGDDLAEELLSARAVAAAAGEGNQALQAELQAEKGARADSEARIRSLQETLAQLEEAKLENSKLLEEAQAGHTEVQHLADELAAAKASLEDQLNSANAARSLIEEELRAELAGLSSEKDGLSETFRKLQEEHQLLMQAQCADKDLLEEMQRDLDAKRASRDGLEAELLAERQAAQTAAEARQAQDTRIRSLEDQLAGVQGELDKEKRAHEDSQRALEDAKDRAAGLVTDLDCERSERGRLQIEESRLQAAVAETSAVLEDLKRTAAEQAAALEAARRLEEAARKDAERALQSEQDAAARALERETARLFQEQAQCRELRQEVERLSGTVLELKREAAGQAEKVALLMRDKAELQTQVQQLKDGKHGLEEQIAEAQGRISELRDQLEKTHAAAAEERQRAQQDISALHGDLNNIAEERYQLQVALKAAQKQLAAAPPPETIHRLGELEGALNQAVEDYQLLLKELSKVRQAMTRKGDELADLKAECQDLRIRLRDALDSAAQYRDEVESTRELTTQLEAKMQQLRTEMEAKQHELAAGVAAQASAGYTEHHYGHPHQGGTLPPVRPNRSAGRARIIPPTGFT